jgi:putative pyoverdin transport system ATP-binding/permease protein
MENVTFNIYVLGLSIALIGLVYFILSITQIIKKKRIKDFSPPNFFDFFVGLLAISPLYLLLYFLPVASYDANFWSIPSATYQALQNAIISLGAVIAFFYVLTRSTIFFPHVNKYYTTISSLLLISFIPAIANSAIVMIVSKSINTSMSVKYQLLFFAIAVYSYILAIRISKRKTARLGAAIVHEINMSVIKNIFRFPYRKYEKIESGKIHTVLSVDVGAIFLFSQVGPHIFTHCVTGILVFFYLFVLSVYSTLILISAIIFIFVIYSFFGKPLVRAWNASRARREEFTSLVVGLIGGFKELVLHQLQRNEYQRDMEQKSTELNKAQLKAAYIDINKTLVSEIAFTVAMGISCLIVPFILNFDKGLIGTYIIAALFLWGPFNNVLGGIPTMINAKISWKRIQDFLRNVQTEENLHPETNQKVVIPAVNTLHVRDIYYSYQHSDAKEDISYGIGPINFKVGKGDIVFIIGGNGSGKTTFLKVLVGLYTPDSGEILINDKKIEPRMLGEYFSVIYSDFYLFKKIYGINPDRLNQVYHWLGMFGLTEKVQIKDGAYTTIDLSKGQRKRLAILKSYLEDRPIYFFDECAADLDPEFKDFFYNELLKKMRDEGKLLIVITHDDKYFDIADVVYKMELGTISALALQD